MRDRLDRAIREVDGLDPGSGSLAGVLALDPVGIAASVEVAARLNETWKLAGFGEASHRWGTDRIDLVAGVKVEAKW